MIEKLSLTFLGAVLAWIFQQYRLARSEDIALLNEYIKDLERFSDSAQSYWLTKPDDAEREQQLAALVRAHHAATTPLYLRIERICRPTDRLNYVDLYRKLYRLATGGEFESARRTLDPLRAIAIADTCARLVHCLRLQRADIISLSRLSRALARHN